MDRSGKECFNYFRISNWWSSTIFQIWAEINPQEVAPAEIFEEEKDILDKIGKLNDSKDTHVILGEMLIEEEEYPDSFHNEEAEIIEKENSIQVHAPDEDNEKTEQDVLEFIKERMRNVLKLKNIKTDVIEASISSHAGDNFLALYVKTLLMNKYKNKGIGLNAINSYKRASNILDKAGKRITGRPDAVLFRKDEEKILHEKINEIRKAFTVKDDIKDYESLLIKLSDTKEITDNFFDKVVVNDENHDIKNNRLELLKMFCNTFDNFIDFSKLEGL